MHATALTDLLTTLRRRVNSAVEPTDAQLLTSFVATRDERAFETLVVRHGPMVLGVCRRVLGHAQDAEDALQATFLILARKAGSVRPAEAVARWLHGVAYHTALKARAAGARRRVREGHALARPNPAAPDDGFEIRPILDQELNRLSNDYRAVVLLCDLEGLTRREAALQLGWPEGTVAGRLARARELLANRLTRRGVALSAGGLAVALAEEIASAAPSLAMVSTVLKAALTSQTPPAVAVLANSVLHAGVATRLWSAALLIVVLGLGGAGACLYGANAAGDPIAEDPRAGQKPPEIIRPAPQDHVKKPGAIFRAPGSYTLAVALTADGKLLARGGADNAVDLWDVASGKKLHTLTGHTVPIMRLAFSPDGKTLASITGSWLPNDVLGEVKLWDVATGKERVALKGHPNRMLSVAFSSDGKTLATSSETVKLWDVETGKEKMELRVAERPWQLAAWSLAFSPDGKTLATGTGEGPMDNAPGTVILWDVTTGKKRETLSGHGNSVTCVEFAPDGKTLASISRTPDKAGALLKLWDVATAKERASIPIREFTGLQYFSLAFTADGNTLISATWSHHRTIKDGGKEGGWGLAVQHWEAATGKARASFRAPFNFNGHNAGGANAGVFFSALSADGKTVAWGGAEEKDKKITGTAHVWEVGSLATSAPKLSEESKKGDSTKVAKDDPVDDEMKKLEGTWLPIAMESGGEKIQGEELKKYDWTQFVWTIRDGKWQQRAKEETRTATLTVDPTKKPKTMDRVIPEGEAKGLVARSLYELDGDILRVCTNFEFEDRRPKGFNAPGTFTFTFKRAKPDARDEGSKDTWTPLFNGKDLTGWGVEGDNPEAWRVENGELLVDAAKGGRRYNWLLTEKTYSEFLLRFEYQLSEKATSGVAVWATRYEKMHPEGPNHLQVKLMDDPRYPNIRWPTGAIFWNVDGGSHIGPDRNAKLEPVGSWNRMEIEARAQALRISVNGVEVHSIEPDKLAEESGVYAGLKRRTGHVGFGKGVGVARFRKIEIKELKPAAERVGVKSIEEDEKLLTTSKWQNEKPEAAWNKLPDKHKNQFGGKPWKKVELEIKKLVDSPDPQGRTHRVQLSFLKPDDELFSFGTEHVEMREEKGKRLLVITNLDKVEYRIEYEFKNGKLQMRGSYLRREPSSGAIFVPEVFDGEYVAIPTTKAGGADVKQPAPKETGDGWVSLFNQKDLAGWKTHPVAPGDWRVEGGILIGRGPKVSHLYTERGDYENLHFRIEAKINAGGNSGQSFRKQFSAKIGGDGYEAQIDSSSHKAKTGSLYIHLNPAVAIEQVLVPVDTWFTQEVIVRGNHIVILVNGQKTVDFIDRNNNYARGHLALQVYDPATVVQFRKIEVKQLKLATGKQKLLEQPPIAANVDDIKPALTNRLKDNDLAAVETLIADLKDKAWQVRCDAAYALGRFGSKAKAAVPALTEALQDESSFVRSRVALALWQIDKHPDAIPALIESLRDPNSAGHRSSAAFALADIGVEAKAAVPALLEALKDNPWTAAENSAFHIAAAKALWQIDRHPAAVPALVECLKEREGGRRMEAAEILRIIGVAAKAAVPALIEALNDEKQFVGRSAAEALGAIGAQAAAAVPALLEALKDKKDRGRVHAAEALWRINKHPAAVLALAAAVQDPRDQADYYAHVALRRIGVDAKAAVPALTEALKAERVYHRVEAAITLWQLNKDLAVVPVLVQALKDLQVDGPVRVASAVASMNKDLAGVPVLIDIPSVIDVNRYVRVYAAKALGKINQHPAAVSALVEALKDVAVCAGAAEALWQINKHPAAVPAIIENLKSYR